MTINRLTALLRWKRHVEERAALALSHAAAARNGAGKAQEALTQQAEAARVAATVARRAMCTTPQPAVAAVAQHRFATHLAVRADTLRREAARHEAEVLAPAIAVEAEARGRLQGARRDRKLTEDYAGQRRRLQRRHQERRTENEQDDRAPRR